MKIDPKALDAILDIHAKFRVELTEMINTPRLDLFPSVQRLCARTEKELDNFEVIIK